MSNNLTPQVDAIMARYHQRRDALIMILQDIQQQWRYLPASALQQVARGLGLPLSSVYSVATFYKAFSLTPQGRTVIHVCQGTTCHVRGAPGLIAALQHRLGIAPGETTADQAFTLKTVNCVGACSMAPVVIVGEQYHANVTPAQIDSLLEVPDETD